VAWKRTQFFAVQAITLSRAVGGLLFVCTALTPTRAMLSLCCYVLAALTDIVDGFLARRFSCTTKVGGALDLFGDKFLTLSSALYGAAVGMPLLACASILLRETFLMCLRAVANASEGLLPPRRLTGTVTVIPIRILTPALMVARTLDVDAHTKFAVAYYMVGAVSAISLVYKIVAGWPRIRESVARDLAANKEG